MPQVAGDLSEALERTAEIIARAPSLVFTAGAGMGVDSGLPDFRGTEGFWRAYPPFARLGLRFDEMANPHRFVENPALAWGFYGHRLGLYRKVRPHAGFEILHRWSKLPDEGSFVFTSNVDGHFQRVGFAEDRVVECHGSILYLQCTGPCCDDIWEADGLELDVDPETFRARGPLPACPSCGAVARPNVLMFGDWLWVPHRTAAQEERMRRWVEGLSGGTVVVEVGAGTAVPTVRLTSEHLARRTGGHLVRINPREAQAPPGASSIALGGLEALQALDGLLRGSRVGDRA